MIMIKPRNLPVTRCLSKSSCNQFTITYLVTVWGRFFHVLNHEMTDPLPEQQRGVASLIFRPHQAAPHFQGRADLVGEVFAEPEQGRSVESIHPEPPANLFGAAAAVGPDNFRGVPALSGPEWPAGGTDDRGPVARG